MQNVFYKDVYTFEDDKIKPNQNLYSRDVAVIAFLKGLHLEK